ncbi:hypothetical protein [Streptomyces sp. NPDC093225]|uniref:hypothetical protein n=1 Tax=Streptomyces sp. NPDC093225 TaxID=3366034 RepID=UPI0038107911
MGSLRNPVGPLPSSIYWRRRAVLASVVALLAILATWVVSSGAKPGSTDAKNASPHSNTPITPGADPSGSPITRYPGGRGASGGGTGSGTGSEDTGGGSAGSASGADGGADSGTDAGGKNGDPGGGSGGAEPARVPAGSQLPNCAAGAVRWTVRSVKNSYEPTERPRFELTATNTSGTSCKLDLGPRTAVLTITRTGDDKAVWSSADCPSGAGTVYYRVPAQTEIRHAVEWDRKASDAAKCTAPPAAAAEPGTYLVEVRSPGLPVVQTSFVLDRD